MKLDHGGASGCLVQTIDVLCDHRQTAAFGQPSFRLGERQVGRIGLGIDHGCPQGAKRSPGGPRIFVRALERSVVHSVGIVRPQSSRTSIGPQA